MSWSAWEPCLGGWMSLSSHVVAVGERRRRTVFEFIIIFTTFLSVDFRPEVRFDRRQEKLTP